MSPQDAGQPGPPGPRAGVTVAERPGGRPPGKEKPRRPRWKTVRNVLLGLLALLVVGPLLAFVIGWMIFKVPTADDAAMVQTATFTYADGSPLAVVRPSDADGTNINRSVVTLDKVPVPVREAVLSAEDRTFYSNPGFDVLGIARAVFNQLTGGTGGGSTITQQYVKISTGQDQATLWRKYKEAVIAVKISKEQTKDQILENYLNTIYLGRGAYGIEAASKAYFGKDVGQLDVPEGALLAGMIQSPSLLDPVKNLQGATIRWNYVLDQMVAGGYLTPAQRAQEKFPTVLPQAPSSGGVPGDNRYHIYERAKQELAAAGISDDQISTEGLTVTTTIDPARQRDAVDAVSKIMKGQPDNLRTALVSIDPRTGAIVAYYGGDNGLGLDYAGGGLRQVGSTFKPFVAAAALEAGNGFGLGSQYQGTSPMVIAGQKVANSDGDSCDTCSVMTAMTKSINTVFYQIAVQIGPDRVAAAAHRAGIPDNLLPNPTGGLSLGDKEVHPVDMAAAYATFAADGRRHDPYIVSKVVAADGRVLLDRTTPPAGTTAFSPQVARNVTESMLDVASSSGYALAGGRAAASKTGTVQAEQAGQNKDAWTVGYTPSLSTAVWVGTDHSDPIKTKTGRIVYGATLPGPIWQQYMNAALKGAPQEQFSDYQPMGTPAYAQHDPNAPRPDYGGVDGSMPGTTQDGNGGNDTGGNGGGSYGNGHGNGHGGGNGNGNGGNGGDGNGGNGNGGNGGNGNGGDNGDGGDNGNATGAAALIPAGPRAAPARPALAGSTTPGP